MVSFSLLCCHRPCSHFWDSVAKESSHLRGLISGNIFEWYLMLEIIQILKHCYCTCVSWDSWSFQLSRIGGLFFQRTIWMLSYQDETFVKISLFLGRHRNMLNDIGKINKRIKEKSWALVLKKSYNDSQLKTALSREVTQRFYFQLLSALLTIQVIYEWTLSWWSENFVSTRFVKIWAYFKDEVCKVKGILQACILQFLWHTCSFMIEAYKLNEEYSVTGFE